MKKLVNVFGILILFFCFFMAIPSRAAEVNDLSVVISTSSHKKCSVQVQTSDNELFGKQVKVYAEDYTGHVLGSTSVSFSAAKQDCEISFDQIVKAGETIYVYAEKENGDTSPVKTKTVGTCYYNSSYRYFNEIELGPKGIMGKIRKSNIPEEGIIEVTISDTVYTGEIGAEGDFKISFWEKTYMPGLSATIVAKCCAGCTVDKTTENVDDVLHGSRGYAIYPHYAVCSNSLLNKEEVFYVEADGYQFNSKEHRVTPSPHENYVYIKYNTVLATGKTTNVWVENEVTGQKSETVSKPVNDLPFSIFDVKQENISENYLSASGVLSPEHVSGGAEYVTCTLHISDETGTLDYEVNSYTTVLFDGTLWHTHCSFPSPKKAGTVLTLWLTDALGASSPQITVEIPEDEKENNYENYYENYHENNYENNYEEDYKNTLTLSGYSEVDTIYYGLGEVTGCTLAGTKVTVTINGKKYTKTVKKKGAFTIKIPVKKIGTKVKIVFSNRNKSKKDYTLNRKICNQTVDIRNYILYQNKTTFQGYVRGTSKGDKLVVTIGGKKYTKKIESNAEKVNYRFRIKPQRAGSKITLAVYNKFGQKRRKCKTRVYFSNKIKVGMTKAQVRSIIGSPTRINTWTNTLGTDEQWVYDYSDGSSLYVHFRNGKCSSYSKYNK